MPSTSGKRLLFDLPRGAAIAGGGLGLGAVAVTATGGSAPPSTIPPLKTPPLPAQVRSAESMGIQVGTPLSMHSMLRVRASVFAPVPSPVAPAQLTRAFKILKNAGFKADDVAEFQTSVGLSPSGIIDRPTYQALQKVEKRIQAKNRLGPGQAGKKIRTLKARLKILGYEPGPINMIYDLATARAMKLFRADQKDLTNGSGISTPRSERVLRREVRAIQHAPYHSRVKNTKAHRRAEARTLAAVSRGDGIGLGDRGPSIAYIKQHLAAAGYASKGSAADFIDERTAGMIEQFQRRSKLPVMGRVDRPTWLKLRDAKIEAKSSLDPSQELGERSAGVARSKKKLRALGYKPGAGTLFTPQMQREVNEFRKREKLGGIGRGVTVRVNNELNKEIKKKRERERGVRATGYENGRAFPIRIVQVQGYWVEVNTAKAYKRMAAAAAKDGVYLQINSGFRTHERQAELYQCWVNRVPGCNPANPPGYSNHQNGLALDLNTSGVSQSVGTGTVYNWLARNAGRFGFSRIASEHWHWEYRR